MAAKMGLRLHTHTQTQTLYKQLLLKIKIIYFVRRKRKRLKLFPFGVKNPTIETIIKRVYRAVVTHVTGTTS